MERLHIGVDEAGYAPVLGPLVATAAAVSAPCEGGDLAAALHPAVSAGGPSKSGGPLVIADSKTVYRSGDGLAGLERGVLAFARAAGLVCRDDSELIRTLAPEADLAGLPWYAVEAAPLPLAADAEDVERAASRLDAAMAAAGIRDLGIISRIVTARDLNARLGPEMNKADVLGAEVRSLMAGAARRRGERACSIVVDRLGGRKDYKPLLEGGLPDLRFLMEKETAEVSRYRAGDVVAAFACRAESLCMTVALSSMVSKYLRELLMRRMNAFFARALPGLRPTAGYPVDGARFLEETQALRVSLGISDLDFVRSR